ncbi:MAG: hypothetical protein ABJ059_18770 [Hyphomicrobiales bacterium]
MIPTEGTYYSYNTAPVCFKGVDIGSEAKPNSVTSGHNVASKDRDCDDFVQKFPGRTAEQHDEMELLKEVQRLNRVAAEEAKQVAERQHQENIKVIEAANAIANEALVASRKSSDASEKSNKIATDALAESKRMSTLHVLWIMFSVVSLIVSVAALAMNAFSAPK